MLSHNNTGDSLLLRFSKQPFCGFTKKADISLVFTASRAKILQDQIHLHSFICFIILQRNKASVEKNQEAFLSYHLLTIFGTNEV